MKRRLPTLLLFLLTFTLLCIPTDVWAQPGLAFPHSGDSGPTPAPTSQSYGWQIGLVDGASILMVLGAAGNDSETAGAIDWFVLGREETKETTPGLQVGGVSLQPTVYPSASGAQLGVVGQF